MHFKTIFNRVTNYKGFVFESASFDESQPSPTLRVRMRARANGRAICDGCGKARPGYDRQPERSWTFVPLWQIAVLLVYAPRRVNCPSCGVKVERVPWGDGKHQTTIEYRWFLATWARRLSWKEVAEVFHTSWDTVFRSVEYAVQWGLANRVVKDVTAIGVDEIQWKRGHKYLTLVLRDRLQLPPLAVDRRGPQGSNAASLLRRLGRRGHADVAIRLQRHVAELHSRQSFANGPATPCISSTAIT